MMTRNIYLDYQATTPLDECVHTAMLPWMGAHVGNPHAGHAFGHQAMEAVEQARNQVARGIEGKRHQVIFTSGATEAANLALLGIAAHLKAKKRMRILACATEHPAVLAPLETLRAQGFEILLLPVKPDGLLDSAVLTQALEAGDVGLVAVMHSHNEIGVIHDIAAIGKTAHDYGALMFSDMTQSLGKLELNLAPMPVDFACFSAHKLYGPMGIGALYVRDAALLQPRSFGGGQERGLRSGTVPVFLTVGFGEAVKRCTQLMPEEAKRIQALRDRLYQGLKAHFPHITINGAMIPRLAGNLHLSFPKISNERLRDALPELQFSTGSACASDKAGISHVLRALGVPESDTHGHVRLGVGRMTTEDEIDSVVRLFGERLL